MLMLSPKAIIIGAGASGLAAAWALHRRNIPFIVLEASSILGGAARTFRSEGYLCEEGPNTLMLTDPRVNDCLRIAGLLDKALDAAPHANRRFVIQHHRLVPLPNNPLSFLISPALSLSAKIRIFREWFIPAGTDENETLGNFVRRRFGDEMLREIVGPFISGVYAGDPERLVVRHAFPKLYRLEKEFGSLLRGTLQKRSSAAGPKGRLLSWPGGLAEFISELAAPFRQQVLLSTMAREIRRGSRDFQVITDKEIFSSSQIILATDPITCARLAESLGHPLPSIANIPYASMTVLHLGFLRSQIGHALDGFGVLVSRARNLRVLGALFSSTLFPNRAPDGHALLTCFIGGRLDPDAIRLDDEKVLKIVLEDLRPLLKLKGFPNFRRITRWPRAIPQYEYGHNEALRSRSLLEARYPGLHLLGNFCNGISLEKNLAHGFELGAQLEI